MMLFHLMIAFWFLFAGIGMIIEWIRK